MTNENNKNNMKLFLSTFIILTFLQFNVKAQQDSSVLRGGGGYIFTGANFISTSSLDNSLRQYHLPAFGSGQTAFTFGGGGGVFLRRIYVGGEGGGLIGLSASNDQYETKLYGGYGLLYGGYELLQKPNLALYPTLGIGGGGTSIALEAGPSYSEIRGQLEPGSDIHTGYMLLKVGLNSDFFIGSDVSTTGGLLIGISAGYQFTPLTGQWEYEDESLSTLEKFDLSGVYLRIKLGFATNRPAR